ncbi:hypothetical protein ONZ45_g11349 [Pleurotus djamor]|nr:hypothetical protein ONZ45_g11349 [Pleurotus djamor]
MPLTPSMNGTRNVELELGSLQLQRQKNASRAVAKLPRELLSRIFLDIRYRDHSKEYSTLPYQREWLVLLHVCHMWREVALGLALFWSWIEPSSISRTKQHVALSKSTPLNMLCLMETLNLEAIDIVMSQFYRFKTMIVDAPGSQPLHHILGHMKDVAAPLLEELTLAIDNCFGGVSFVFPKEIPLDEMPSLRTLTLTRGVVTAALPSLPRLEHLTFSADRSPVSRILESLKNNLNITHLRIDKADYTVTPSDDIASLKSSPVLLPKLESISIVSEELRASRLFGFLNFPSCMDFEFKCYHQGRSSLRSLARVCSHVAGMGLGPQTDGPTLDLETEDDLVKILYRGQACLYFELPLSPDGEPITILEDLLTPFSALPFSEVQHLGLDNIEAEWLQPSVLDRFKNVTSLTLQYTDVSFFLGDHPDDIHSYLPKLNYLCFKSDCFSATAMSSDSELERQFLRVFLTQRVLVGKPIHTLEIGPGYFSEVDERHVEEYRGLVQRLDIV